MRGNVSATRMPGTLVDAARNGPRAPAQRRSTRSHRKLGWLVILGTLVAGTARAQDPPLPEEAQKAAAAVKAELQKVKGDHAQLIYKDEAVLKRVLPEHQFIIAR